MRVVFYFAIVWLLAIASFNAFLFGYHKGHKDGYNTAMSDAVLGIEDPAKYILDLWKGLR